MTLLITFLDERLLLKGENMTATLNTKMKKEPIRIGPISPKQELVFQRATEVDFMIIGGSRGK